MLEGYKRIAIAVLGMSALAMCAPTSAKDFQENVVPALNQVRGSFFTFGAPVEKGGKRVLFIGNSITLHGPKPSIGWTNHCGMAASGLAHDYVHVYANLFAKENANASFGLLQVSGSVEMTFTNVGWSVSGKFAAVRRFRPDLIVLFFGANVPHAYDSAPASFPVRFGAAMEQLLDCVDPERRARTLISEGYYIRPQLEAEKRALAVRRCAVWVPMDDIRRRADTHGRFNHPNDFGMRLIAERFWDATKNGTPAEPQRLAWKGTEFVDWTRCTNSIRSFAVTDEGLTAKMSNWRDACIEATFDPPMTLGPEDELTFRARALCPSSGRLSPEGLAKPLYVGMREHSRSEATGFLWRPDGEWHEYAIRPFGNANGRALQSLKIRLPPEGYDTGVVTFGEIALRNRPVAPSFTIMCAEADGFARVGEPVELRVRIWNRGTSAAKDVALSPLPMPAGVELLQIPQKERMLERDGTVTFRATVRASAAGSFTVPFSLSAAGVAARRIEVPVAVSMSPRTAKTDYVPEPRPVKTDYEVAACYYPGWSKREAWDKVARICPERRPLLGWYDETCPEVVDWQIKWYVEHGIGIVMLDWYWRNGQVVNDHWVHAFAKARYRNLMKWMVVWCNERQTKGEHSPEDWRKVARLWIENYFTMPEYCRIDGRPAVGIYVPDHLVRDLGVDGVRQALREACEMAKARGFGGIHFTGFMRPEDDVGPEMPRRLRDMGFDEVAHYNCRGCTLSADGRPDRHRWQDTMEFNLKVWELYAQSGVPFWPLASSGWDDRPWNHGREIYGRDVAGFRRILEGMKAFADRTGRRRLMIGPLNEWGEGSFIEPNRQFGFGMYDAIRDVFCEMPPEGWPVNMTPADVGLGPYDLPPGEADPDADAPMDLTDGHTHGWVPLGSHVKTLAPTAEGLHVTPGSSLPAIVCNFRPFSAADHPSLHFRIRTKNVSKDEGMRIYWKTEDMPWCEQCAANVAGFRADGQPHDCTLELSSHPGWRGRICAMRLQPAGNPPPEYVLESFGFTRKGE